MLIDRTAGGRLKVKPHVEWRDSAVSFIQHVVATKLQRFCAIDVMIQAEVFRFRQPKDLREWGPAMVQAKNYGIIKKVGTSSHPFYRKGAKCALWEAV